jgi:hypothetical protein
MPAKTTKTTASKKTATTATTTALVRAAARRTALVQAFAEHKDAAVAAEQQRYMKSAMPFFGLKKPLLAAITSSVFNACPPVDHDDWLQTAQHLWRSATHREEWYATLEWTALKVAVPWQSPQTMDLYQGAEKGRFGPFSAP